MKLGRIEHWKCGEPMNWRGGGGYTYVWVPEDMSVEELDALCEKAQESYLSTEREFKALAPVSPPGYGPTIHESVSNDKTVGDLRNEYAVALAAFKVYQSTIERSRKAFAHHLNSVSGGTIIQFWESEPELKVELDWGHNHGVTIEHSPTRIADYPFPEDGEDDV